MTAAVDAVRAQLRTIRVAVDAAIARLDEIEETVGALPVPWVDESAKGLARRLLATLQREGGSASVGTLRRRVGRDVSTIRAVLATLERKGQVTRGTDPDHWVLRRR